MNGPKISIGIGLVLTGLGVLFAASHVYGAAILALGVLVLLYLAVRAVGARRLQLFWTPDDAREAAEEIYERARSSGGDLLATHIFPRDTDPSKDIAVRILSSCDLARPVSLTRILILENRDQEIAWIENLFGNIGRTTDLVVFILARYPVVFSRLVRAIIPRANVLLYQNGHDTVALLGLDQLELLGLC